MPWKYLIEVPWIVFVAYWALGALKTRRTERKESFASRYGILLLEIAGFALLFLDEAEIGLDEHTTYAKFRFLIRDHILASGTLVGLYAVPGDGQ